MDASVLAGIAGLVLSLALSYLPMFGTWFNAQDSTTKVQINGGLLVVVAAAIFGLSCAGLAAQLNLQITCDQAGAITLFGYLLTALIANQTGYIAFVKPFKRNNPAPKPLNVKGPQPK